ncbi:MAG: hypothetical protein IJJ99_02310 [Oscillospiraceae bacterium]|nr:hypothetical protein [Oscillospiraceae bacterium]
MEQNPNREVFESRHEFVPPPEKRQKKRTRIKKGQAAVAGAALLAGILLLSPVGRTLPAPGDAAPPAPTETIPETQIVETTEAFVELEPPVIELYPITVASELYGVVTIPEPERVLGLTISVWETTQERELFEIEVPEGKYKNGSLPLLEWCFWDDYKEHADEYEGSMLDGGNYRQQLRAEVSYDAGDGTRKTFEYVADPVEDPFFWLRLQEPGDEAYAPDSVTIIIDSFMPEEDAKTVLVNEPDKVTDSSTYSVRAEIDHKPVEGVFVEYVSGTPVVHIPIPEGTERKAGHIFQLYLTKYVEGFGKALEFFYEGEV